MGHSMGGHGALIMALKNPGSFRSVSAFAPIVNPSAVPWGQKAFKGYLGDDKEAWAQVGFGQGIMSLALARQLNLRPQALTCVCVRI